MPPYHTVYIDGFGGQNSFRVKSFSGTELDKSYHGAVGGYVFVDAESDDISVKLYRNKAQFPSLLRSYLLSVMAIHYVVRVLVLDNASELVSEEVQDIAMEYGFVIRPASPYTPQGNSLAENAVGIVCTITRALMIGAPHLPANRWGLAVKQACIINHVLPKARNQGRSAYEVIRKIAPDLQRMYLKVFGAPVQYKSENRKDKIDERTIDGFYVGVDWPSVLVDDRRTRKILHRSVTKVRVYQGAYCDKGVTDIKALRDLIEIVDYDSKGVEVPRSLPSIRELIDQGEKGDIDSRAEYIEECSTIDSPSVRSEVADRLAEASNRAQNSDSIAQRVVNAHKARGPEEASIEPEVPETGLDQDQGESTPTEGAQGGQSMSMEEAVKALEGIDPREVYLLMARDSCDSEEAARRLEPYLTLRVIVNSLDLREKYENNIDGYRYPKSAWEALLKEDWREWIDSIRKEYEGWKGTNTFEIVKWEDVSPGAPVIRLGELYLIKRSGKHKFRQYARGDMMRKGIDYKTTFSATVGADTIRFFFSVGTALGLKFRGGDVMCAYLQGKQRTELYCYQPSYAHLVDLGEQELSDIRSTLRKLVAKNGSKVVKDFARDQQGKSKYLWKLHKSVYGVPDAGNEWSLERDDKLVGKLGFTRSVVDQCLYWKTGHISENGQYYPRSQRETVWVSKEIEVIVLLSWVDDLPTFATDRMYRWYKQSMSAILPMEFFDPLVEFVSIEVTQDLDRGITELNQPKYWEALRVRFRKYLPERFNVKVPLPEGTVTVKGTEEEHRQAEQFPYAELVGAMAYPAAHTKLEMRYTVSVLSRHMSNWTLEHWGLALKALMYGISTKEIGLMFSQRLDRKGLNVLSAYGDANFRRPPERSGGCSVVMMNGAAVHVSAKQHSTIATSTTSAELTEQYLCSNHIMGFRNMMSEMGFELSEPTVLYQDNKPAIDIANNNRQMSESTKHMDVRVFKVRERIEDQEVYLEYVSTCEMIADLGTKALGARQFTYLRDLMNGYALVRAQYPDMRFKCHLVLAEEELARHR